MAQQKITRALDQRETGDVIKFFETFDGILEKNSGIHDSKCLSIDSAEPPCPVTKGMYTKVKLTDDAIHITNIDKSYISMRVSFDLRLSSPNASISFAVPAEDMKGFKNEWYNYAHVGSSCFFVGFKSAIHVLDAYRIYSKGRKTACEQTEALYENAITYFLKPQQEIRARPHTYSPWENVRKKDDCVCGVYIPWIDLFDRTFPDPEPDSNYFRVNLTPKTLTIEFDLNIPFDDFLPLSGMTMFPNFLFGNLQMELKETIQNNLVWCILPLVTTIENLQRNCPTFITPTGNDMPYHERYQFFQINDTVGDVSFATLIPNHTTMIPAFLGYNKLSMMCTNGQILSCRSNINGFCLKEEVMEQLREQYMGKELILPAQFVDYQAFSQTVQPGGIKCNTTYTLTNVSNIILTFPRTGNEITVSKNPQFGAIQLQVESKPYPDKPFSTLETAHCEYNLVNAGLDSIWSPNDSYAYSLVCQEVKDGKQLRPVKDNTNYCLNCSTERLCGAGVFCDGLTKQSAHISLNGNNIDTSKKNPYLYPDGANKNDVAPLMMLVQDCFWRCTIEKGAEFIINRPEFVKEKTGTD